MGDVHTTPESVQARVLCLDQQCPVHSWLLDKPALASALTPATLQVNYQQPGAKGEEMHVYIQDKPGACAARVAACWRWGSSWVLTGRVHCSSPGTAQQPCQ